MASEGRGDLRREKGFVTDDPHEAEDRLRTSYGVTGGVRISTDTDGVGLSQHILASRDFAVSRFRCTTTTRYDGPLDGPLCVGQVHAGHLRLDTAHGQRHSTAGDLSLMPPHQPWQATTHEVDLTLVTLDRDAVARYAADTCGIATSDLVFTGLEPRSTALVAYWNATVTHIRYDILGDPAVAENPVVVTSALRSLAAALLAVFPNTALESRAGGTGAAQPRPR